MLEWLFLSLLSFAQMGGNNVVCPKSQYSELGDTPRLRFKSNESHILICGKEGKEKDGSYYLNEFDVYYYHPYKKRLMSKIMYTLPNQKYRIYSEGKSLFFEELVYTGAKRVPGFRVSARCDKSGACSFSTVECIYNSKKHPTDRVPKSLLSRLKKANCI